MICPYCGETLKDTVRFCTNCGKKQPAREEENLGQEPAAAPETPEQEAANAAEETPGAQERPAEEAAEASHAENGPQDGPGYAAGTNAGQEQAFSAQAPQGGTLSGADILLFGVSMIEMFWVARLFGIAAMVFAIRAFFKQRDGDEETAHASRRVCAILLLVGLAVKVLSWLLGIIFKVGAITTILGWLGKLL